MPGVDVQGTVFEELRQAEMIYVDKTAYFHRLAANRQNQKLFFFARPRRFGKSLMLSTFKAIFEGKPYLHDGRPVAIVGLAFHKGQRELQGVAYEVFPTLA